MNAIAEVNGVQDFSSAPVFKKMQAIVEADGYPFLKNYKQDFYEHDQRFLERTFSPESRYLWMVRDNGTHLVPVGIHPKISAWADAVFGLRCPLDLYLIESATVRRVSDPVARQALTSYRYTVSGNVVSLGRRPLASFQVQLSPWASQRREGKIVFTSMSPVPAMTLGDLIALAQIAESEVILVWGRCSLPRRKSFSMTFQSKS